MTKSTMYGKNKTEKENYGQRESYSIGAFSKFLSHDFPTRGNNPLTSSFT